MPILLICCKGNSCTVSIGGIGQIFGRKLSTCISLFGVRIASTSNHVNRAVASTDIQKNTLPTSHYSPNSVMLILNEPNKGKLS
ncbi:hypothetical protein PSHT_03956 [Puccinia striiformis]|uniref:Uncharacterized protein n=1 Tax=Puccinia striiformis TaxID=27350 RepID=A0A2S4WE97_9BASI|nr:hypothetical protein PSHT_03956 [Puccinia striiformis]